MNQNKYKTFKEFYPYYLSEHKKPITKIFHAIGSLLSLFFLILFLKINYYLLPIVLLIGYGFAWISHLIFEQNKPATFKYPWWSQIGDHHMTWLMLTGRLKTALNDAGVETK